MVDSSALATLRYIQQVSDGYPEVEGAWETLSVIDNALTQNYQRAVEENDARIALMNRMLEMLRNLAMVETTQKERREVYNEFLAKVREMEIALDFVAAPL